MRIRGSGFNAIDANPAPDANCVKGNPNPPGVSCCTTRPQAVNVCDTGTHNPFHDGSQCVEFLDGQATWQQATAVSSVTPTSIVVGIPQGNGGGIPCMGGMGEMVHVTKWDYQSVPNKPVQDEKAWCTTAAQKDIF